MNAMLVNEVRKLLGERDSSIAHILRNQNAISHRLATFGRAEAPTALWISLGPTKCTTTLYGASPSKLSKLSNEIPLALQK